MNDLEFDVLDELYFIQPFEYLLNALHMEKRVLKVVLEDLYKKGWIKCYRDPNSEIASGEVSLEKEYDKYHYLATKAGLLAHQRGG